MFQFLQNKMLIIAAMVILTMTCSSIAFPSQATDANKTKPGAASKQPLPSGHPTLPSGHPPTTTGGGMIPDAPMVKGSLVVKVIQGTKGGPKVTDLPLEIRMMYKGKVVNTLQAKVNSMGLAMLEEINLIAPFTPVITTEYGSVTYQAAGRAMSTQQPDQMVRLTVFETTEKKPDWRIKTRHLMLQIMNGTLVVNEIIAIKNPTDKTWLGEKQPATDKDNESPKRISLIVPLPKGAKIMHLGQGLNAKLAEVNDGKLIYHGPIMAGQSQLQIVYSLPSLNGNTAFDIHSLATTDILMVFVQDGAWKVNVKGMMAGQMINNGQMKINTFKTSNLKTGQTIHVSITGLPTNKPKGKMSAPKKVSSKNAKILGGVGGTLLVLTGFTGLFFRNTQADHDVA